MELYFTNKPSVQEVMEKAEAQGNIDTAARENLLLCGENFIGLSKLYNTYQSFVDLVYIDPPYNTGNEFTVSENRANSVSRSKAGDVVYSDFMPDDDFLSFMYERFVLLHQLLTDKGNFYVHIDVRMGHYFKIMLDEIFGSRNFKNDITRIKSNPKNFSRRAYGNEKDMILFYSKNADCNIWNEVKIALTDSEKESRYSKIDSDGRRYTTIPLHAPGECSGITGQPWRGMNPPEGRHWRTEPEEFDRLDSLGLIEWSKTGNPRIKKFADQHNGKKIQDVWTFKDPQNPLYPTQKNLDMVKRIIRQSSDENSFVLDCFA